MMNKYSILIICALISIIHAQAPAPATPAPTATTPAPTGTGTATTAPVPQPTQQGTTNMVTSQPNTGNVAQGETIMKPQAAAANGTTGTAAAQPNNNLPAGAVGMSKSGKPLYLSKLVKSNNCACQNLALQPCACRK